MPSGFWDYIHLSRTTTHNDDDDDDDDQAHHNLQEGLFQIASQTCNILVQVNNTNNINLGSNFQYDKPSDFSQASTSTTRSTRKTTFFDLEQSVVLLQPEQNKTSQPSTPSRGRFHKLSEYKRRLSVSWQNIITINQISWLISSIKRSLLRVFHICALRFNWY